MFRLPDAGIRRRVLIAAAVLTGLAVPALGADWQPITGSQPQTTPRSPSQSSGSGGGYGIPTWGRGGGWSGEPDHPHPPVTPTSPTANCGLRVDPRTAVAGEYATVIATLSDTALRDLGRLDLLVGGQVAAGVSQQGSSFTYAFRVPSGERQVDVSLTAYAARTGNYGQIRTLCTASANLTVMDVLLDAPNRVPQGGLFSAGASIYGGQPPYRFVWSPSGRSQGSGSESTYFNNFETPGTRTVSVSVTDGAGRTLSKSKSVEVVACATVSVAGPQKLAAGETGHWTVTYPSPFPPYRLRYDYGGNVLIDSRTSAKVRQYTAKANPAATALIVSAEDSADCKCVMTYPVRVTGTPIP